jgi:hypothetical protein
MKDHITIAGHDGAFAAYIARLKTVPAASEDVLTAESDYQRQQRALSCRQTESNLMPGVAGLVMGSRLVGSDPFLQCYVLTEVHSGPSRILGSYNDQGISCVGAGFQTASE